MPDEFNSEDVWMSIPSSEGSQQSDSDHQSPSTPLDDWGPALDGHQRPWIPAGEYQAFCTKSSRYPDFRFKRTVGVLRFRIFEGEHRGTVVERFFNLKDRMSSRCAYPREWIIANNNEPPPRADRMAMRKFVGKLFLVRVVTVDRAWDGGTYPQPLRYSKVAGILALLFTNERIQ